MEEKSRAGQFAGVTSRLRRSPSFQKIILQPSGRFLGDARPSDVPPDLQDQQTVVFLQPLPETIPDFGSRGSRFDDPDSMDAMPPIAQRLDFVRQFLSMGSGGLILEDNDKRSTVTREHDPPNRAPLGKRMSKRANFFHAGGIKNGASTNREPVNTTSPAGESALPQPCIASPDACGCPNDELALFYGLLTKRTLAGPGRNAIFHLKLAIK
jgi:hypothetical protein